MMIKILEVSQIDTDTVKYIILIHVFITTEIGATDTTGLQTELLLLYLIKS